MHRDLIPVRALCSKSKVLPGKYDTPEYSRCHDFPLATSTSFICYYLDIAPERKNFSKSSVLQNKELIFDRIEKKFKDNVITCIFTRKD